MNIQIEVPPDFIEDMREAGLTMDGILGTIRQQVKELARQKRNQRLIAKVGTLPADRQQLLMDIIEQQLNLNGNGVKEKTEGKG